MSTSVLTRRTFLLDVSTAAGGLLLSGRMLLSREAAAVSAGPPKDLAFNAWLRIGTDDQVTLICSQSEMGQGVMTTLPAILAEELGADWRRVRVEISPAAEAYRNPRLNWQFTGNSESTPSFFDLLRQMGASAREMLISAAAARWKTGSDECRTEDGRVIHSPSGRSVTFGEVAGDAAKQAPPAKPRLKDETTWRLLGRSLPRVDVPAKLDGTAAFGLDVRVPRMVYAAVRQNPVFGGGVASVDKSSISAMPGVIDIVAIPNGVAVVAKSSWEAIRALDALAVKFDDGPNPTLDSAVLAGLYRSALVGDRWFTARADGRFKDPGFAIDSSRFKETYTAEYGSQFLAHATMEPMNCTAEVKAGECTIWGPLQGPELAQIAVSQTLGIPKEKVRVERTMLGGGFGRRLLVDFVLQAVLVSKAVGRPVQVVWSRGEDMRHDFYRPATLQTITAGLSAEGRPEAIAHRLVSPTILHLVFPPAVTDTNDPSCLEGLLESPYAIASTKVDLHLLKVGVPTSVLRTTGYGPNIFAVESFVDELAHKAGKDPYGYRRELLSDPRALAVLDRAAEESGWKTPPPAGRSRGVACAWAFGTHISHVVELSVDGADVRIHRVTCVIDCGTALDPEICKASQEGGVVWGLGAAFFSEITFAKGRTVQSNWHDYQVLRMDGSPRIDVSIVNSGARPLGGTGEVGPVTLVPAVTNAIFAATNRRLRTLPLSRHGFRLA